MGIPAVVTAGDRGAAKLVRGGNKVFLELEGLPLVAHVVAALQGHFHQTLVADATGLTIEAALTTAGDRMRTQLRKLHDKVVDRRHGKA